MLTCLISVSTAPLVSSHEITRRASDNQCIINPVIPAYVKTWYHFKKEPISVKTVSQTGEVYEHLDAKFLISPLEPRRRLTLLYRQSGALSVIEDWDGDYPAMLSSAYITITFTDDNGLHPSNPMTLFIPEEYTRNYHSCELHINNAPNHRKMHVQVAIRPLGHHDST